MTPSLKYTTVLEGLDYFRNFKTRLGGLRPLKEKVMAKVREVI